MPTFINWVFLLVLWPMLAVGQLQISHPMARLVVQRGANGNGQIYLSGRFTGGTVDRVEAQLTPYVAGQGTVTGWQTVQTSPTNNIFLGNITGTGGWYVLTVRTILNNAVTAQATVQPVGIGEVFVTAGQSNSRGLGVGDNDLGTATDRVNAIDSINHSYPPGAQALVSSGDPSPVPVYKALTATRRIFPMAESSWGWGELGDYIVNRFNVPVGFYVVGWDASTVDNWWTTANGTPACNRYYCVENWPNLQPYTNLKNVMHYYLSVSGARAVLWHQGEAEYGDTSSGSIPDYASKLRTVIQKSRQDFGGRNLAWMLARASFDGNTTRSEVVSKQQEVIDTPGLNVYQGPYNDTIINRNAGTTDVHFRNSVRLSPHPQYYLNPNSIPADMGLSRFARNWNNSLNDAFFQNAQPITPTQFAVTGNLPVSVLPGSVLNVTFATLGTFNADNQWQVQLLDSLGHYKSVLGSSSTSPIQVTLPNGLTSGHFQIRVVSTSPFLPAVPSNIFLITTQSADVSLGMSVNQITPDLNTPFTVNITVRNDGPNQASGLVVQDRLPTNLAFLSSSDFSLSGGVLTSSALALGSGSTQTLRFVAQPIAPGTYQNAAEIAQATSADPDSQPSSGTGDGQDDATQIDFRTRQVGSELFVSPNPNQIPLPGALSNQPAPDPNKADVSIRLTVDNRTPAVNDVISYSLIVTNMGGLPTTGLDVAAYLPVGQQFLAGDDFGLLSSNFNGATAISSTKHTLAAGSPLTLRFRAIMTATGSGICSAQVTAMIESDPDSTPGNGIANGEDDTAQIDIRVKI